MIALGAQATPVRVMVTEGGAHPASKWATMTATQVVSIDPGMDADRRDRAIVLRRRIAQVLAGRFAAVRPSSSSAELDALGASALESIQVCARGTPWEANFIEPTIGAMLLGLIRRNLFSAADIALRTE